MYMTNQILMEIGLRGVFWYGRELAEVSADMSAIADTSAARTTAKNAVCVTLPSESRLFISEVERLVMYKLINTYNFLFN